MKTEFESSPRQLYQMTPDFWLSVQVLFQNQKMAVMDTLLVLFASHRLPFPTGLSHLVEIPHDCSGWGEERGNDSRSQLRLHPECEVRESGQTLVQAERDIGNTVLIQCTMYM